MKRALALVVLAACGHSSPTTTRSGDPLTVSVDLYVLRDGQRVHVAEREEVRSGEVIELEVTPSSTAFLYVVQQRPGGQLDLLAPDGGDVAFSAGETVRLPPADADYELYLDTDTGVETLVIMASPRPIAELDTDAGDVVDEARAEAAAPEEVAPEEVATDAGVPEVAIDGGVPAPEQPVTVKRKKTRKKTKAVGARPSSSDGKSISLNPRGVRKRPKRVQVEADAEGVVIYPYVVIHR